MADRHARAGPAPPVRPPPVRATRRGASYDADVLHLQRTIGNRAVRRLLETRTRMLARFAEGEHKLIGDTAWGSAEQFELAPGVKISFGDAVALGDYFESFDRMRDLAGRPGKGAGTRGELLYVLWVDIWDKPAKAKLGEWYDKSAVFHREQLTSYFDSRNIGHFPNPVEGDLKRPRRELDVRRDKEGDPVGGGATYRKWHEEAVRKAYEAGLHYAGVRTEKFDEAVLTDGFACHFLTDAFSASHVTTPRLSIKEYWNKKVPSFDRKIVGWLADKIDHGKWKWYERGGAYLVEGSSIHAAALNKLAHKLTGFGFGDLVSLVVHDVNGSRGVKATVGGKPVTLVGDSGILQKGRVTPKGQATFDAATEAARASIGEVQDAYIAAATSRTDYATFRAGLTKADGLYAGERLMPVPVSDDALAWRYAGVDSFLADARMNEALVEWGRVRGHSFAAGLEDFNPKAQEVVKRVLIAPLTSGDEDQVRQVLREIVDTKVP
jgi:hypothetical protein